MNGITGIGSSSARRVAALMVLAATALAGDARAHLVSTELGPFYDGAVHALVSPEDLLTILGLAIVAAHAGREAARRLLVALTVAWGAGIVAGYSLLSGPWDVPAATAVTVMALGVVALLKVRVPARALAGVGAFVGFARGLVNGSAVHAADGRWLPVIGVMAGVLLLTVILIGGSTRIGRGRSAVVLRVAGSWVAAIGLLMIGWQLRG